MAHVAFDGVEGRIEVTGYLGVSGLRERSISFWIRTNIETGTICWWGTDPGGLVKDGEQNRIRMSQGRLQLFGRGSFRESSSTVNDGNFHHVVFTWASKGTPLGHEDFSQANVYIDSVLDNGLVRGGDILRIRSDGSQTTDIAVNTPATHFVVIGAFPTTSGTFRGFYQGDLDDFAIYDVVLASSTVTSIYNSGTPGIDLVTLAQAPGLELWYKMGDGVGDTAPAGTMIDQQPFFPARNGVTSTGTSIV